MVTLNWTNAGITTQWRSCGTYYQAEETSIPLGHTTLLPKLENWRTQNGIGFLGKGSNPFPMSSGSGSHCKQPSSIWLSPDHPRVFPHFLVLRITDPVGRSSPFWRGQPSPFHLANSCLLPYPHLPPSSISLLTCPFHPPLSLTHPFNVNVNANVNMRFIVRPLLKEHGCIT